MLRSAVVSLVVFAGFGCDCLYDFSASGRLMAARALASVEARDCYDDECEPWQALDAAAAEDAGTTEASYDFYAGGNGSRCERPTRIEFRAEGCNVATLVPDSDKVVADVTLECP